MIKQIELSENTKEAYNCFIEGFTDCSLIEVALQLAVKDERYEYAAVLRDEINRRKK